MKDVPSALKREHPALQNIIFIHCFKFFSSFWPPWIRIRIPNPDPLTRLNPDPKHWWLLFTIAFLNLCHLWHDDGVHRMDSSVTSGHISQTGSRTVEADRKRTVEADRKKNSWNWLEKNRNLHWGAQTRKYPRKKTEMLSYCVNRFVRGSFPCTV